MKPLSICMLINMVFREFMLVWGFLDSMCVIQRILWMTLTQISYVICTLASSDTNNIFEDVIYNF